MLVFLPHILFIIFPVLSKYSHLSDSISLSIYNQDIKYLKERYDKEVLLQNKKLNFLRISLFFSIGVILLIFGILYFHKKARSYKHNSEDISRKYEILLSEKTELENTIAGNNNRSRIGQKIIKERIDILNAVISGYLNNNGKAIGVKATNAINKLTKSREDFQESIRDNFNLLYPEFMSLLQQKGLNDEEIIICCLYCIGLSGKAIKYYTGNSRHYIECLAIREKFGLNEHDTNIGPYLRKLLSDLYPSTIG